MKWESCYTFIKGFAMGRNYNQLIIAMSIAKEQHIGQFRKALKDGAQVPYICHPVEVTAHLISLGIIDEDTLVVGMLHDVREDCKIPISVMRTKGISDKNCQSIMAVSKFGKMKQEDMQKYFDNIIDNGFEAVLVKMVDRCHNLSTMGGAFSKEKMLEYVCETKTYILPLAKAAKDKYPHISNQIIAIRIHIESLLQLAELYATEESI